MDRKGLTPVPKTVKLKLHQCHATLSVCCSLYTHFLWVSTDITRPPLEKTQQIILIIQQNLNIQAKQSLTLWTGTSNTHYAILSYSRRFGLFEKTVKHFLFLCVPLGRQTEHRVRQQQLPSVWSELSQSTPVTAKLPNLISFVW